MPIYMDRHDVPGVSAKDVAEVHVEDLKIQSRFNCRVLTYWFDERRGTAFCLVEAPNKNSVSDLHNKAHGLIPNQIIEVEGHLVEAFLGRIEDPHNTSDSDLHIFEDPAFRTILVTELKNFPLINLKTNDAQNSRALDMYNHLVQNKLKKCDSGEIKHISNGFMASFEFASNALKCALQIQNEVRIYNHKTSANDLHVAIGLSAGDPVTGEDDLFGETIQLAKRLGYIAGKDQILVSSAVKEHYEMESPYHAFKDASIKFLTPLEEIFLRKLMDVLEESWNQDKFHVGDLARQMALSKAQLYRKTVSLTGHSPNQFIKEFRLNKALVLIEKHRGNISEVAFDSGFSNPSYFTQCFHKKFGVLPREYETSIG